MDVIVSNMNTKGIVETLYGLQNMHNSVLVLYNAHAKGNQELTNLANLAYYLLWNYSKSLIELQIFLNASLSCEEDYAKGQLCTTINECLKHVIGFEIGQRNKSLWIKFCIFICFDCKLLALKFEFGSFKI